MDITFVGWYWIGWGVLFLIMLLITAEKKRRKYVQIRIKLETFNNRVMDRIDKMEQDLKWWKQAHIKLQDQVIRGREIMYERLKIPQETQDEQEDITKNEDIFAVVPCQSCKKNKVTISKDAPYFGIICHECRENKQWVKS